LHHDEEVPIDKVPHDQPNQHEQPKQVNPQQLQIVQPQVHQEDDDQPEEDVPQQPKMDLPKIYNEDIKLPENHPYTPWLNYLMGVQKELPPIPENDKQQALFQRYKDKKAAVDGVQLLMHVMSMLNINEHLSRIRYLMPFILNRRDIGLDDLKNISVMLDQDVGMTLSQLLYLGTNLYFDVITPNNVDWGLVIIIRLCDKSQKKSNAIRFLLEHSGPVYQSVDNVDKVCLSEFGKRFDELCLNELNEKYGTDPQVQTFMTKYAEPKPSFSRFQRKIWKIPEIGKLTTILLRLRHKNFDLARVRRITDIINNMNKGPKFLAYNKNVSDGKKAL
jgi:hypothetical protein